MSDASVYLQKQKTREGSGTLIELLSVLFGRTYSKISRVALAA